MDAAAGGDRKSFSDLALATQDELYRYALRRGLADADAGEVVQETLTRAYVARRRWRAGGDAVGWLHGIAANVVRETFRRRERPAETLDGIATSEYESDVYELDRLREAIAALPERQREAVSLRMLEGLSVRQAAERMGCAEGTVKATLFAAMESLRKAMKVYRDAAR